MAIISVITFPIYIYFWIFESDCVPQSIFQYLVNTYPHPHTRTNHLHSTWKLLKLNFVFCVGGVAN